MSKPTTATIEARPVSPCPPWCSPAHCRNEHGSMWHSGIPTRVESDGVTCILAVRRTDEHAFPDEWDRPPWIDVTVTSKVWAQEGTNGNEPLELVTDFSIREAADLSLCLAEFGTQAAHPDAVSVEAFTVAEITSPDGALSYTITGRKSARSGDAVRALRELLTILDEQESAR